MARSTSEGAKSVLVVSDDPALRDELRYGFSEGVDVRLARDATDAWPLLNASAPDVVVVDIQTGRAGGYSLAMEMAQSSLLAGIPILMLLEREQDAWLAEQSGARGHLTKPIEVDRLVDRTLSLLN